MQPKERSALLYDGVYTLGMRILNAVAAVILGVLTARVLGPAGKGVYALPMVEAGLVSTVFTGLTSATSYFMLNRETGRSMLRTAFATGGIAVCIAGAAVLIIAALGHAVWAAAPAMASLPAAAVNCIAAGYAVGIRRVRATTTITVATTLLNIALVGSGFLLVARSPWVAIVAWVVTLNVVALAAAVIVSTHARSIASGKPVSVREYVHFASKTGVTNLVSLLNYRGDLYVVAVLTSVAALGLYSVAVSAAETLLIATQSAALAVSPHVGSMDRKAAADLTARCVRNNMLVAGVLCTLLFIVAPDLVGFLYGENFLPLVPAMRVLLIGVVALSLGSPVSSYFTLKLGKPEIPLWLAGFSAATCIAVAIILVPMMGITGAAIASTVAYLVGQAAGIAVFARGAGVGFRRLLLPTLDDAVFYARSLRRIAVDGRRLFIRTPAS